MKPSKPTQWQALLIFFLFGQAGCFLGQDYKTLEDVPRSATLTISNSKSFSIRLAITTAETVQGLSGIQADQFEENEGMLFVYKNAAYRRFWMPDTYFDLDIYFLDRSLKVVDIERSVEHHPGRNVPPKIATTRDIYSQYILEIKSSSPLSKQIHIGDQLQLKSKPSLQQIIKLLKTY